VATETGLTQPSLHVACRNNASYCGLTSGGSAYCWAASEYFDTDLRPRGAPGWERTVKQVVQPAAFTMVAPGASHICGLSLSGEAYCWGHNADGQLGTGDTASASVPVRVANPF
jgi:alpha-tubulin suppressor-like RCC1 family protein